MSVPAPNGHFFRVWRGPYHLHEAIFVSLRKRLLWWSYEVDFDCAITRSACPSYEGARQSVDAAKQRLIRSMEGKSAKASVIGDYT